MKKWEGVFAKSLPVRLRELFEKSFGHMVECVSKVLLLAIIMMCVAFIPKLVQVSWDVGGQLAKVNMTTASCEGKITTNEPVRLPLSWPYLIFDTTGIHSHLERERFLITDEGILYRWFGREHVKSFEGFSEAWDDPQKMKGFVVAFIIFILPSLAFFLYGFLWIKYMCLIVLFGTGSYVLLDLTHFRLPWKQAVKIAGYAIIPVLILEVVSVPITTKYLVPLVQVVGVNMYLVPLILYSACIGLMVCFVHACKKKEQKHADA